MAAIGFITLFLIVYLLMRSKCMPIVIFSVVPVLMALLLGFMPAQIGVMINVGLGSVWSTAVLFIFSVSYFGIMSDAGMFDPIVDYLVKRAGANVVLVTIVTGVVAILGHLDGATATTCLITIPAMLPLYKKMNIRPTTLLLITGVSMGVMNLVPWGGPIVRVASVMNKDVTDLWHMLLPFQIVCVVLTLIIAGVLGVLEMKKGAGRRLDGIQKDEKGIEGEGREGINKKLTWFNLCLTVLLIAGLTFAVMPSNILFMIAFSIALAVNFRGMKEQRERFKAHAGDALDMAATLLAAGVFIGIMNETAVLEAMVDVLIGIIPEFMGRYMNLLAGIFSLPMGAVLGADTFYYGVFPLLGDVAVQFGVSRLDVGIGMLIGKNVGMIISPLQPTTYLACGLAGVELRSHMKTNFMPLWIISLIMVGVAMVLGLIRIY